MVNKIKIYKNFKILRKHRNAMILIGNFDGLHLGHQRLFKEAKKYKKKYNSKIGVVTFDPIPKMYFDKSITNYRLSNCLLYTSPSPRDGLLSRMPSSA